MQNKFIVHLIGRINDKANRFLAEQLREHNIEGIAPSHGDIIGALCLADQLPMKELARWIHRDKSTVTSLVNKLVHLGYVEKERDPEDLRVTLVRLSAKGRSVKSDIMKIGRRMRSRAYGNLTAEERRILWELLTKLHDNF